MQDNFLFLPSKQNLKSKFFCFLKLCFNLGQKIKIELYNCSDLKSFRVKRNENTRITIFKFYYN